MIYIGVGILGFLILRIFDIFCLKKVPLVKPITWVLGCMVLIYSLVMLSLSPDKLPLPAWSVWLGWVLLPPSTFLLIYALFINLPLRQTYIESGVGEKLVVTGLYALVRHPGVYPFTIVMLSLILVSRSQMVLIAAPVFVVVDILLVAIQDRLFFGRMFPGYSRYRQETPMLVPSKKSINTYVKKKTGV